MYTLTHLLVVAAIAAVVFTWLGWALRGSGKKPKPISMAATPKVESDADRHRIQHLQERLQKAEEENKASRQSLAALQKSTVPRAEHEALQNISTGGRAELESLRTQLNKSRESLNAALARENDAAKGVQVRRYELESELSRTREELVRLKDAATVVPKSSEDMQAELDQLRKSLSSATATFGQAQRERDAARLELERLKNKGNPAGPATTADGTTSTDEAATAPAPRIKEARPKAPGGPSPEAARQLALSFAAERASKKRGGGAAPAKPESSPEAAPQTPVATVVAPAATAHATVLAASEPGLFNSSFVIDAPLAPGNPVPPPAEPVDPTPVPFAPEVPAPAEPPAIEPAPEMPTSPADPAPEAPTPHVPEQPAASVSDAVDDLKLV